MRSADYDLSGASAKVRECKISASVFCGADTEGDGKFEAGLCVFFGPMISVACRVALSDVAFQSH